MSRLNGNQTNRLKKRILEEEGYNCAYCWVEVTWKTSRLHHKDNNRNNYRRENLCIACVGCNSVQDPRGRGKKRILRGVSSSFIDKERPVSAEFKKNQNAEPKVRGWVWNHIRQNLDDESQRHLDVIVDAAAEIGHCSQDAVKRYIRKMCSTVGFLKMYSDDDGNVFLNVKHRPRPRKKNGSNHR